MRPGEGASPYRDLAGQAEMQLLLQQTRFQNLFHSGYQESRHSLQIKSGDDDGRTKSFK